MNVEIFSAGVDKVQAIKIVREATGWGLKEAKEFVDKIENGSQTLYNVTPDIVGSLRSIGAKFQEIGGEDDDFIREVNKASSCKDMNTEQPKDEERINIEVDREGIVKEGIYIPVVPSNMISKLDRESTMRVLVEVGKIARESEEYELEIEALKSRENQEKLNAEALRSVVSLKAKIIMWTVILVSFFGLAGGPLSILIGIGAWIIMNCTVIQADLKKHAAENNANAERYIIEKVVPIQKRLEDVYLQRDEFNGCGKLDWAFDVVGKDMFYSACIQDLYNIIKNRRADSLKEAMNKYDDVQHKARMEEMQASIKNASEITALESIKQTIYTEEIAKSAHQTAIAAKKTAYNTKQIDKNTRKLR